MSIKEHASDVVPAPDPDAARRRIASDLSAAGLRRGAAVLVHSSLSSMGHVPGGPETVILGLLDALGPQGTLLMPALSHDSVNAEHPFFDVLHTPTRTGAIPERFRTRPGTLRSVAPTHSVCGTGARAESLLAHHDDDTPCGPHSPYRLLRDADGQDPFLGCGLRPNTSMHSVEEVAQAPYLFGPTIAYRVLYPDGREGLLPCRRHSFKGWAQRYDRLGPLCEADGLRVGKVLSATVHVLDCPWMWQRALEALSANPYYFVEEKPPP